MKSLISIIMPIYNGEKYLENSIKSILKSSYKNIELLLINDGSKDQSLDIIKYLGKKDTRIKIFNKKNEGIAKTRNFGLVKANGKYICFADQDDEIPFNAYEILIKNLEENGADLCIGGINRIVNNKEKRFINFKENFSICGKDEINEYLIDLSIRCLKNKYKKVHTNFPWTVWNCIYNREIIVKNGLEFKRFVDYEDDFLFNFDYIKVASKISFEKNVVYKWRKNISSESSKIKYIENFYEKRKMLTDYIFNYIKCSNNFDRKMWINCTKRKNIIDEFYNTANPKNPRKNVENLNYLMNLKSKNYIENFKPRRYNFIEYIKIKFIYFGIRYVYYGLILKIKNILKKILLK